MATTRTRPTEGVRAARRRADAERRRDPRRSRRTTRDPDVLFGRYRLEERLGAGGSAEVWRAHDEQLDREVALKLLHRHLLPDQASRTRFAAEARSAARLAHPGIITVHDIATDDDRAAIVLELVPGQSLADRITLGGRLDPVPAADVAAQVAEALDYAHGEGVVHRDVKPGNILIDAQGRARLVDFGIASALTGPRSDTTATGTVMGTLRYLSPEQLAGEPASAATDIWGLGTVLYEMLEARPPFHARSPVALAGEQHNPPPSPAAPVGLAGIALQALSFDQVDRPRTAGQMGESLRRWLAEEAPGVEGRAIPVVAAVAAVNPSAGGRGAEIADRVARPVLARPIEDGQDADGEAATGSATVALSLGSRPATNDGVAALSQVAASGVSRGRPTRRAAALIALGLAFVAAAGLGGVSSSGPEREAGAATTPSPSPTAKPSPSATVTPKPTPRPAPPRKKHHKGGDGAGDEG